LQAAIRTSSRVLIFNAARNIEYAIRRDLFRHLMRLDAAFFRRSATGDVMSRLTNDLGAVRGLFGPGVLNVVNSTIIYASTLVLLVGLSPSLTLYALLPYPFLLVLARLSGRVVFKSSREIQEQLGLMSTSIQEDLAGSRSCVTAASAPSTTPTSSGRCAWCARAACSGLSSRCSRARARSSCCGRAGGRSSRGA
jgi:ATP-binding cassette subfamily B protein